MSRWAEWRVLGRSRLLDSTDLAILAALARLAPPAPRGPSTTRIRSHWTFRKVRITWGGARLLMGSPALEAALPFAQLACSGRSETTPPAAFRSLRGTGPPWARQAIHSTRHLRLSRGSTSQRLASETASFCRSARTRRRRLPRHPVPPLPTKAPPLCPLLPVTTHPSRRLGLKAASSRGAGRAGPAARCRGGSMDCPPARCPVSGAPAPGRSPPLPSQAVLLRCSTMV